MGKGQFSGVVWALKGIGNLHCSGAAKGDHSIANNIMQQKGSFGLPGKCK